MQEREAFGAHNVVVFTYIHELSYLLLGSPILYLSALRCSISILVVCIRVPLSIPSTTSDSNPFGSNCQHYLIINPHGLPAGVRRQPLKPVPAATGVP